MPHSQDPSKILLIRWTDAYISSVAFFYGRCKITMVISGLQKRLIEMVTLVIKVDPKPKKSQKIWGSTVIRTRGLLHV